MGSQRLRRFKLNSIAVPVIMACAVALAFYGTLTSAWNRAYPADSTKRLENPFGLFEENSPLKTADSRFEGGAFVLPGQSNSWLGTYVGGDAYTGTLSSTPFVLNERSIAIPIDGYPNLEGNQLMLEVMDSSGHTVHEFTYSGENPAESGGIWRVGVKEWQYHSARLRLVDTLQTTGGWLAVGAPKGGNGPTWILSSQRDYGWYLIAAVALASFLFVPGLAMRTWYPGFPAGAAWLPLPGLFVYIFVGIAIGCRVVPHGLWLPLIAFPAAIIVLILLARRWYRHGSPIGADDSEALGIYALVSIGALAFGVLPLEVDHEFDAHTVRQSRMISSPSDHVIPFDLAVFFAQGKGGIEEGKRAFGTESGIASRGPLVPLMTATFFRILNLRPGAASRPTLASWPINADGFFVARIVGIVTNALVILGGALLAASIAAGARRTTLVWLAIAPVTVINVDFVWPKLLAAFFLCLAVAALIRRRSAAWAGVGCALAYLSHPIGALFTPAVAFFAAHQACQARSHTPVAAVPAIAQTWIRFAAAFVGVVIPWILYRRRFGFHEGFLHYPLGGGLGLAPAHDLFAWIQTRLDNAWFTGAPGAAYFSGKEGDGFHAFLSSPLSWAIAYSKALPNAVGLGAFGISIVAIVQKTSRCPSGFRLHLLWSAFVFLLVFWGYSSDGLGRNCLEPLAIFVLVASATAFPEPWQIWRWILLLTAVESASVRAIGLFYSRGFVAEGINLEVSLLGSVALVATLAPALWYFRQKAPTAGVH